MHFVKLPGFRGVVKSLRELRRGGQLCLGKRRSETLGERVFTYFSRCWVPEKFDTKKYQNKSNEQRAEEQSADLVSGAGLRSRFGCFCLTNDKTAITGALLLIQGGTGTHAWRTLVTLASYELTSRKRQSSGLS